MQSKVKPKRTHRLGKGSAQRSPRGCGPLNTCFPSHSAPTSLTWTHMLLKQIQPRGSHLWPVPSFLPKSRTHLTKEKRRVKLKSSHGLCRVHMGIKMILIPSSKKILYIWMSALRCMLFLTLYLKWRLLYIICFFPCKQSTSHVFRSATKIESVLKHVVDSGSKHQGSGKGAGFYGKAIWGILAKCIGNLSAKSPCLMNNP